MAHQDGHRLPHTVLDKYLTLPQPDDRVQAEYIWIGGSGQDLRSKTRVCPPSSALFLASSCIVYALLGCLLTFSPLRPWSTSPSLLRISPSGTMMVPALARLPDTTPRSSSSMFSSPHLSFCVFSFFLRNSDSNPHFQSPCHLQGPLPPWQQHPRDVRHVSLPTSPYLLPSLSSLPFFPPLLFSVAMFCYFRRFSIFASGRTKKTNLHLHFSCSFLS